MAKKLTNAQSDEITSNDLAQKAAALVTNREPAMADKLAREFQSAWNIAALLNRLPEYKLPKTRDLLNAATMGGYCWVIGGLTMKWRRESVETKAFIIASTVTKAASTPTPKAA
ncbi:MAG: hypothetical protein KGQ41_04970 [Alphaproteobacteria bacterium]|nr:hypothetical protein [Alphaproteobacteria bacterium]